MANIKDPIVTFSATEVLLILEEHIEKNKKMYGYENFEIAPGTLTINQESRTGQFEGISIALRPKT